MTTRSLLQTAASVLCVTAAAYALNVQAQAGPGLGKSPAPKMSGTPQELFAGADRNHDDKLSREEAETIPPIAVRFDELDKDGDHMLTLAEFTAAFGTPTKR